MQHWLTPVPHSYYALYANHPMEWLAFLLRSWSKLTVLTVRLTQYCWLWWIPFSRPEYQRLYYEVRDINATQASLAIDLFLPPGVFRVADAPSQIRYYISTTHHRQTWCIMSVIILIYTTVHISVYMFPGIFYDNICIGIGLLSSIKGIHR